MFTDNEELEQYIKENYTEVTDSRIDDDHFDIFCDTCKIVRGFQVVEKSHVPGQIVRYNVYAPDFDFPHSTVFRCPVCHAYKIWIVYTIREYVTAEGGTQAIERKFKITCLPNEGIEDISELPDEPKALKEAYRQAIRAMDANALLAAAAMFRRALQVITREIFKVKPGNLANELKLIVGIKYNGVAITTDFSDNGYIIKEAGNQGAHPDSDPDLLEFAPQDAEDLRNIFMDLVSELFVVPEVARKAKQDFLSRRKIMPNRQS